MIAAVSALVVACGGGNAAPAALTPNPDVLPLSSAMLRQHEPDASPYEWSLISDGDLTYSEYEASALAYVGCVTEAGLRFVEPPVADARGKFWFVIDVPDSADGAVVGRCRDEFHAVIDLLWATHVSQSGRGEEHVEAARRALVDCLRDAGLEDIPDDASGADYLPLFSPADSRFTGEHQQTFFDCRARVAEDYNLPWFGG
jgi:hypothetical protein